MLIGTASPAIHPQECGIMAFAAAITGTLQYSGPFVTFCRMEASASRHEAWVMPDLQL